MIYFNEEKKDIHLQTETTSMILRILDEGHVVFLYYGSRLKNKTHFSSLYKRKETPNGVAYRFKGNYSMIGELYPFSHYDKGDYREASIDLSYADGSITCEFFYDSHTIEDNKLAISLMDPLTKLKVILHFEIDGDKIIRCTELSNPGEPVRIHRITWTTFDTNVTGLGIDGAPLEQGIRTIETEKDSFILENEDQSFTFSGVSNYTIKAELNHLGLTRINIGYGGNFTLEKNGEMKLLKITQTWSSKKKRIPTVSNPGIEFSNKIFSLRTKTLSYRLDTNLNHIYFGITAKETIESALGLKEFNTEMLFEEPNKYNDMDFQYISHKILTGKPEMATLPSGREADESLIITLKDKESALELQLIYGLFIEADCYTRSMKIINTGKTPFKITKALSMTMPIRNTDYSMISLDGDWAGERHIHKRKLYPGTTSIDSKIGSSSALHSPFLGLVQDKTREDRGRALGFSLIYSGNHTMNAHVDDHLTISGGINPHLFAYTIEDFMETPEVVFTLSEEGLNGMSRNFHKFVNEHIVPKAFQYKERPILINNWEATYFKFNERKLLSLARGAKRLGVELFVLDDGWFGNRDDDFSSLGDYTIYRKKLRHGLKGLCKKINRMGMDFGLWVEPEMISIDSDLYRAHPEYLMKHPDRDLSFGRNQGILDLANPEVVDHVYAELEKVISSCNITYIKWDMNRNFSDTYSSVLDDQRECAHRYMLGLYSLFRRIMTRFPDVLFEGCASGGDRFDLGILSYFPQIWTSDCSDATERTYIKTGTSLVFPQSTMGSHVSAEVNHQLLRLNPIETRFNVSAFGILGFELDLKDVSRFDKKILKRQIAFYKDHRKLLQFGTFTRLESPFDSNYCSWMVSNAEASENILMCYQELLKPWRGLEIFKVRGLEPDTDYLITNRPQLLSIKIVGSLINHVLPFKIRMNGPVHNLIAALVPFKSETEHIEASGTELNHFGFLPKHQFLCSDYNENVRLTTDFTSRLYLINKAEPE